MRLPCSPDLEETPCAGTFSPLDIRLGVLAVCLTPFPLFALFRELLEFCFLALFYFLGHVSLLILALWYPSHPRPLPLCRLCSLPLPTACPCVARREPKGWTRGQDSSRASCLKLEPLPTLSPPPQPSHPHLEAGHCCSVVRFCGRTDPGPSVGSRIRRAAVIRVTNHDHFWNHK